MHLAASPFVGGPESQMLGLIEHLPTSYRSCVLSFSEGGRCRALLEEASRRGAETVELRENTPRYRASTREIADHLRDWNADVLCCHGYKPDILGLLAAWRAHVPVVSISHGWTAATVKVRLNEIVDRLVLQGMDRIVCVSERQARRVRRAGVARRKIVVIRNAINADQYAPRLANDSMREQVLACFAERPRLVIGAAGRLSPEKGYQVLVEAAAVVLRERPDLNLGFVHFGDGVLRGEIQRRIDALGIGSRFVLGGFRDDLRRVLPQLDLFVLPSYTEGLPVVVLEAFAAGVGVVATAVGGTPEVVEEGVSGRLVPAGDPAALAHRIIETVAHEPTLRQFGERGRSLVLDRFTFANQRREYEALFETLAASRSKARATPRDRLLPLV